MRIFSEIGKVLWERLDYPEEWAMQDKYTMEHIPSNTSWWVANGSWFFNGWPSKCLGLIERHFLYWKANKIIKKKQRDIKQEQRDKDNIIIAEIIAKMKP